MDKINDKEKNIEELNAKELLDFLDESNTYFIKDDKSGIVGNKKTGVMLDRRTGKTFPLDSVAKYDSINQLNYDFCDYKESLSLLNSIDDFKSKKPLKRAKNKVRLKRYIEKSIDLSKNKEEELPKNKEEDLNLNNRDVSIENEGLDNKDLTLESNGDLSLSNKDLTISDIEDKINNSNNFEATEENSSNLELKENILEEKKEELVNNDGAKEEIKSTIEENNPIDNNEDLSLNKDKESEDLSSYKDDKELLDSINSRFNNIEGTIVDEKKEDKYNFSSFEDFMKKEEEKNEVPPPPNPLEKFKSLMDFEDYLLIMESDENILKSPFDENENYEELKVVVSSNDDDFTPFDTRFEVEEIQSYDINNENMLEEGMIPELNLNQSISKKVSIREVIKHKQKKKQEQKELQDKLFFETLDERIEEFKNFKENEIDSQEVLNAINVDLNKINSSIRVEFKNLSRKRNKMNNKDKDKFSLQNLLHEIYEEKGEDPKSLDLNELDIESVKKDLASKENDKQIVN